VKLNPAKKWSRPAAKPRRGKALASVARVRRGIATGANSFFVISERERQKLGIPVEQLKPCITSPRVFSSTELTAEVMGAFDNDVPRWLIDCADPEEPKRETPLGRYLKTGEGRRLRINKGYLARNREPWHRLEQRPNAPILFTYFNRDAPRFVRNRCGAIPLNNWLVIEPNESVDPDALYRALQSQSVREQFDGVRRVYGGGLWKLEPSELLDVRVNVKLSPSKLSNSTGETERSAALARALDNRSSRLQARRAETFTPAQIKPSSPLDAGPARTAGRCRPIL
jgi:adenine-specific DNA-methyltransferase